MIGLVESISGYASLVVERSNASFLALAILVYILSLLVSAFRWLTASRLSYSTFNIVGASESLLVGIFVNNLLTFYNVTGELARIGWASLRLRVESARLLVGALAERASELPVALLYLSLSTGSLFKLSLLSLAVTPSLKSYASGMFKAVRDLASSPSRLALVLLLSLTIWVLDTTRILLVASAFNVSLAFTAALGLTVIHIASRFSPTPAGVGVLEGGFIGYLRLLGVPLGDATLIVLGERFVSTLIPTVAGALLVLHRGGISVLRASIRGVSVEGGNGN
ncbi:MAG: flippase-like domain-containing protein [Acidilobaceae archaeon]|jgi:hypothetical protein